MPYYEFHYLVGDLLEFLKEKNKAEQGQKDQVGSMNPKMPTMPKMPSMKMPRM